MPVDCSLPPVLNLDSISRAQDYRARSHVSLYAISRDGRVSFRRHHAPADTSDVSSLFVCRVLRWCASLKYYVGIVVDVIEPG